MMRLSGVPTLIDQILKYGKDKADETEVFYVESHSLGVELKRQKIEIGAESVESGLVIRTIKDGKIGVSSTDNPARWKVCFDASIASSKFSDQIDWKGLPGPEDISQAPLAHDDSIIIEPEPLHDLIARIVEGASRYPVEITAGSADISRSTHTIANSSGLIYSAATTNASVSVETIVDQSTGFEYDSSWKFSAIDPEKVGETAAFFASSGRNGSDLKTGTYDIVLSPLALSHLLDATVIPALSGRSVHAGRSYYADKLGDAVAGQGISIVDDPFDPRGIANCAWDDEGLPARRNEFIKEGILKTFAYDLKTAYRYGKESTGSAVRTGMGGAPAIGYHNLILEGPVGDVMTDGIYINDIVGAHTANPMSGDFSVEISQPFFIRNGALESPIRTGMLSGNVFDMIKHIDLCSPETRTLGSQILPSVRVNGMSLVGRI